MKSARINFGQPNTEYKLEINDAGEATSCYNQDTDTEYIGGGGGDFSTAEVTIINHTGATLTEQIPTCLEAGEIGAGSPAACAPFNPSGYPVGETIVKVPLYKGTAIFASTTSPDEMSGNITQPGLFVIITGDGTITWRGQ